MAYPDPFKDRRNINKLFLLPSFDIAKKRFPTLSECCLLVMIAFGMPLLIAAAADDIVSPTLPPSNVDSTISGLPPGAVSRLGGGTLTHKGQIDQVAFSSDGKHLCSWSADSVCCIWEAASRKLLMQERTSDTNLRSLYFSEADDSIAILQASDGSIHMWRFADGSSRPPKVGHGSSTDTVVTVGNISTMSRRQGHSRNFAVSENGRFIASVATAQDQRSPQRVQVWKPKDSGSLNALDVVTSFKIPHGTVEWLGFVPGVKHLVIVSHSVNGPSHEASNRRDSRIAASIHRVSQWSIERGSEISHFDIPEVTVSRNHSAVAISPDGKRIALATSDNSVQLILLDSGKSSAILAGHKYPVTSLAFSPNGQQLAAGSIDNSILLWDLEKAEPRSMLKGHQAAVTALAFSPDSKVLASGSIDGKIKLWDVQEQVKVIGSSGHQSPILCCDITNDGQTAITGSADGKVIQWAANSGVQLRAMPVSNSQRVTSISFIDEDRRYAATHGTVISIYATDSGELLRQIKADGHVRLTSISFSESGHIMAAAGSNGIVYMWSLQDNSLTHKFRCDRDNITAVCTLSPDGKRLAVASKTQMAASTFLYMLELPSGKRLYRRSVERGNVEILRFSPSGLQLLLAGYSSGSGFVGTKSIASPGLCDSVLLWDVESGSVLRKFPIPQSIQNEGLRIVNSVEFLSDGKYIITGERSSDSVIYETQTGLPIRVLSGHREEVKAIAVAKSNNRFVTASMDSTALVWDGSNTLISSD